MTWLTWLGFAVVIAAIAAVTGIKPRGGRPVTGTHLMGAARVALIAIALVLGFVALRTWSAG